MSFDDSLKRDWIEDNPCSGLNLWSIVLCTVFLLYCRECSPIRYSCSLMLYLDFLSVETSASTESSSSYFLFYIWLCVGFIETWKGILFCTLTPIGILWTDLLRSGIDITLSSCMMSKDCLKMLGLRLVSNFELNLSHLKTSLITDWCRLLFLMSSYWLVISAINTSVLPFSSERSSGSSSYSYAIVIICLM